LLPAQASADGRYKNLLGRIEVPGDLASYGKHRNWGSPRQTVYLGYTELPRGYWVYVAPYCYISTEPTK